MIVTLRVIKRANACRDTGPSFVRVLSERPLILTLECRIFGEGATTILIYLLGLTWPWRQRDSKQMTSGSRSEQSCIELTKPVQRLRDLVTLTMSLQLISPWNYKHIMINGTRIDIFINLIRLCLCNNSEDISQSGLNMGGDVKIAYEYFAPIQRTDRLDTFYNISLPFCRCVYCQYRRIQSLLWKL